MTNGHINLLNNNNKLVPVEGPTKQAKSMLRYKVGTLFFSAAFGGLCRRRPHSGRALLPVVTPWAVRSRTKGSEHRSLVVEPLSSEIPGLCDQVAEVAISLFSASSPNLNDPWSRRGGVLQAAGSSRVGQEPATPNL